MVCPWLEALALAALAARRLQAGLALLCVDRGPVCSALVRDAATPQPGALLVTVREGIASLLTVLSFCQGLSRVEIRVQVLRSG